MILSFTTQKINDAMIEFVLFIYSFLKKTLFLERGEKRGRETSMCGCLSCAPYWGPGQQPRHAPWLGFEPTTPWFTGQCSIHWATPARAEFVLFDCYFSYSCFFLLSFPFHSPSTSPHPSSLLFHLIHCHDSSWTKDFWDTLACSCSPETERGSTAQE